MVLQFKKKYKIASDKIVMICDVISDNDFDKLIEFKIFNSKYFPFYAYLTFTHDSFSVFNGHQLQVLENLPFTIDRKKLFFSFFFLFFSLLLALFFGIF